MQSDWLAQNLELEPRNHGRSTYTFFFLQTTESDNYRVWLVRLVCMRVFVYVCGCVWVPVCVFVCASIGLCVRACV